MERQDTWDPAEAMDKTHFDLVSTHGRLIGPDGQLGSGGTSVNLPYIPASTMEHDPETLARIFDADDPRMGYLYGRHLAPNTVWLGQILSAMEGMEAGLPVASGMAAISAVLGEVLNPGDKLVAGSALYGGTVARLQNLMNKKHGVNTVFVDPTDTDGIIEVMDDDKVKACLLEAASNPTLAVPELDKIIAAAKDSGVFTITDGTFPAMAISTGILSARPDAVVHSATKFISGESDTIAGFMAFEKPEMLMRMMDLDDGQVMLGGAVMDGQVAHRLTMRMNTLPARMRAHAARAQLFAERLRDMRAPVVYPGLTSHPGHETFERLRNKEGGYGFGGMLALDFGDPNKGRTFAREMRRLGAGRSAVSLGFTGSALISVSGETTSSELSEQHKASASIKPGWTRVSVDIAGSDRQRWAAWEEAVERAMAA